MLERLARHSALARVQTVAERLSRNVVVRRRLPARFGGGRIYVSPGAMLKLWWPGLETVDANLFVWARSFVRQGDVVWDIGANVGLFAFAAAHQAGASGRVLAVEADIWLAELLRRSARQQPSRCARVDVLPTAVSAADGIARFNIAARSRASNFLEGVEGSSQAGGVHETHTVTAVTLDWLLDHFPAPGVVKIDVEGAEHLVLSGGRTVLSAVRPRILCEVRATMAPAVTELLRAHGYKLFDLERRCQPVETAAYNTLALPGEMVSARLPLVKPSSGRQRAYAQPGTMGAQILPRDG